MKELVFACLRPSPEGRPNFQIISCVLDVLLLQVYIINQEFIQLKRDDKNNNNNNNNNDSNSKTLLRGKYKDLNEELMDDILGVLPQCQQGKTTTFWTIDSKQYFPKLPSSFLPHIFLLYPFFFSSLISSHLRMETSHTGVPPFNSVCQYGQGSPRENTRGALLLSTSSILHHQRYPSQSQI